MNNLIFKYFKNIFHQGNNIVTYVPPSASVVFKYIAAVSSPSMSRLWVAPPPPQKKKKKEKKIKPRILTVSICPVKELFIPSPPNSSPHSTIVILGARNKTLIIRSQKKKKKKKEEEKT